MNKYISLFFSLFFLLNMTACGGGGEKDNSDIISSTPTDIVSIDEKESISALTTLSTMEIIQNPRFDDGINNWNLSNGRMVKSELTNKKNAIRVDWGATQTLISPQIEPTKSYSLKVLARNTTINGTGKIIIKFKLANGYEVYRQYQGKIVGTELKDNIINFTAPNYTGIVDIFFAGSGSNIIVERVSLKETNKIPNTEVVMSKNNSYVPSNYKLVFNDEFYGTNLNRSKWFTRYIYNSGQGELLGDEKQRYRDNNNHIVKDGILRLTANKVSDTDINGVNYESGMIRSDWTLKYGYVEARVKVPKGLGVFPAFWLNSDASSDGKLSWPPEIDIFEIVNNGTGDSTDMLHSGVINERTPSPYTYLDSAFNTEWTYYKAPFDFAEGWHTIGTLWDESSVTIYLDGKKIYTRSFIWEYKNGQIAGPAHIILNLAIGGHWAGRGGIDDTAFPQALEIDWIRAYKPN